MGRTLHERLLRCAVRPQAGAGSLAHSPYESLANFDGMKFLDQVRSDLKQAVLLHHHDLVARTKAQERAAILAVLIQADYDLTTVR